MNKNTPQRILTFLGGQSAPPSMLGHGRRVLFVCPQCHQPWLMDGKTVRLRLAEQDLAALAGELHADITDLPACTCRLCALHSGTGIFEIDEYDAGEAYGFNWEGHEPTGAHLLAVVNSLRWMAQPHHLPVPDVVLNPRRCRAVLHWLSSTRRFPSIGLLSAQDSADIAPGNPPGHGASGTERWQWKGAIFQLHCPPLDDEVMMILAMALPPQESLDVAILVETWKLLADLAAQGRIAGEP